MTETPLRRAARALMLHHDIDPDVYVGMHGDYGHWLEAARAVLRAIWEPSDAQIQAARDFTPINHPADVWPAMIEAAIAEG